jgi:hypothetical protein
MEKLTDSEIHTLCSLLDSEIADSDESDMTAYYRGIQKKLGYESTVKSLSETWGVEDGE